MGVNVYSKTTITCSRLHTYHRLKYEKVVKKTQKRNKTQYCALKTKMAFVCFKNLLGNSSELSVK